MLLESQHFISFTPIVDEGDLTLDEFYEFVERKVTIKSEEEIDKELMDAFEKFNEGNDFLISKEEFRKVMTKLGDEPLSEGDADTLLESLKTIENNGMLNVAG